MTVNTSNLWDTLSEALFSKIDETFVETFRRPGGPNNRLAAWDPFDKTARYYKFMLFNEAMREPEAFFDLYRRLGAVNLGDPLSVKVRGCEINIDYLFSVEEVLFLSEHVPTQDICSVVEIGAGFGRTCHALLTLLPNIANYTIVDIPNVLNLSRLYLKRASPDHFHKISFISAGDEALWWKISADLAINIDSFQEMPPAVISGYMENLVSHCRYFYVKNPIGKYRPENIGLVIDDPAKQHDVFSLGYCREVIDLFDDERLARARQAYVRAYKPEGGALLGEKPLGLFPYLQHALYRVR